MKSTFVLILIVLSATWVTAQQSPTYKLEEHAFNSGGEPGGDNQMISKSFKITLASIAEPASAIYLSSAGFRMDVGFDPIFPAPGEVAGLGFTNKTDMTWSVEHSAGTYNLYRQVLSSFVTGTALDCLQKGYVTPSAQDLDPAPTADGFAYLVTVRNRLREEGTTGQASTGLPRATVPCP